MDERARALTHFLGNRCYLRIEEGRCAALVVDVVGVTDGAAPRFVCSIYEARPDVCRALERGGGACRSDRHEKGERPLLAVESLLRRT
jgi:Fe-S-cluster containining protein